MYDKFGEPQKPARLRRLQFSDYSIRKIPSLAFGYNMTNRVGQQIMEARSAKSTGNVKSLVESMANAWVSSFHSVNIGQENKNYEKAIQDSLL